MGKTAIAAALEQAGIAPPSEGLIKAADFSLDSAGQNFEAALEAFYSRVSPDAALLWELFAEHRRRVSLDFLRKRMEARKPRAVKSTGGDAASRAGGASSSTKPSMRMHHPSDSNPGGADLNTSGAHISCESADRDTHAPQGAAGGRDQTTFETQRRRVSPPASGIAALARVAQKTILDTLTFDGKPCRSMTQAGFQDYARRKGAKAWAANALAKIMPPMGTVEDASISDSDVEAIWLCARQLNSVEIRP